MTIEEIRKNAPDGATHHRDLIIIKQYFMKNSDNGFWYQYVKPFWFYYDSEKPLFIKPL